MSLHDDPGRGRCKYCHRVIYWLVSDLWCDGDMGTHCRDGKVHEPK